MSYQRYHKTWDVLLLRSTCQGVTRYNYSIFHMFKVSKPFSTKNLRNVSIYNLVLTIAENLFQTTSIILHTDWLNCASPECFLEGVTQLLEITSLPKQIIELSSGFLFGWGFWRFLFKSKIINHGRNYHSSLLKALSSLMVPYLFMSRGTICKGLYSPVLELYLIQDHISPLPFKLR